MHCNTLQHHATHYNIYINQKYQTTDKGEPLCNTLQHVANYFDTLPHTAKIHTKDVKPKDNPNARKKETYSMTALCNFLPHTATLHTKNIQKDKPKPRQKRATA